jgi:hypothetical protein
MYLLTRVSASKTCNIKRWNCPAQLIKHYTMKMYGKMDILISIMLTSALAGHSGQLHVPAALSPRKDPVVSTG